MQTFIMILTSLLFGYACGQLAKRKGRNANQWFISGTLFGIFALILLALLPPPKLKRAARPAPEQKKIPALTVIDPTNENKLWYYLTEERVQEGPMSLNLLTQQWQTGKVNSATFVWNEELEEWKALKDVLAPE